MSVTSPTHDDLERYLATFSEEEKQELALADAAIDLAALLYHARRARGLTQKNAARLSGLRQQVISRWERSHPNVQVETLRKYLSALGYSLSLVMTDTATGEIVATSGVAGSADAKEGEASEEAPLDTDAHLEYLNDLTDTFAHSSH